MNGRRPEAARLLDAAFLAGVLAYAIFGIDTRLIYHWQAPALYLTREFTLEHLSYPGGPADYVHRLVLQAFPSPVWGGILLTALLAGVAVLTEAWRERRSLLRFVPVLLCLYPLSLYYERTALLEALLLGLGAAIPFARGKAPRWTFLVAAPMVYFFGGAALVVFGAIAGGAGIERRQYGWAAGFLVFAAALPVVAERLLYTPHPAASWFFAADRWETATWWSLFLFYGIGSCWKPGPRLAGARWLPSAGATAVLAALVVVTVLSYRANDRDRRLAALDYYASKEDWAGVIASSARLRSADFNSLTRYEINLALHETNRLGDAMFRFPQSGSTMPALRTEAFLPYMIRVTDLLLRLGRANDAEHFGNEALILGDSDPRVLRLMAEIEMAKGRPEAARKVLTVLSTEPGSASWAQRRLADPGSGLAQRSLTRTDDFIAVWQNPDKPDADANRLLLDQLKQDPTNRMAFEFLMGNSLLARDLPGVRALLPRMRQLSGPAYETPDGRRRTPRHYQEAFAMYMDAAGEQPVIDGVEIEPETLNRMAIFKRIMSQSAGRNAAMQAAWSRFRDTYFFYYVFGPGDYR